MDANAAFTVLSAILLSVLIIGIVIGIVIGSGSDADRIKKSCELFGAVEIGDIVYECRRK